MRRTSWGSVAGGRSFSRAGVAMASAFVTWSTSKRFDVGIDDGDVVLDGRSELGTFCSIARKSARNASKRWRGKHCPMTEPVATSRVANNVVVPWRV